MCLDAGNGLLSGIICLALSISIEPSSRVMWDSSSSSISNPVVFLPNKTDDGWINTRVAANEESWSVRFSF